MHAKQNEIIGLSNKSCQAHVVANKLRGNYHQKPTLYIYCAESSAKNVATSHSQPPQPESAPDQLDIASKSIPSLNNLRIFPRVVPLHIHIISLSSALSPSLILVNAMLVKAQLQHHFRHLQVWLEHKQSPHLFA